MIGANTPNDETKASPDSIETVSSGATSLRMEESAELARKIIEGKFDSPCPTDDESINTEKFNKYINEISENRIGITETMREMTRKLYKEEYMTREEIDREHREIIEQEKMREERFVKYRQIFGCKSENDKDKVYIPENPPYIEKRIELDRNNREIEKIGMKVYLEEAIQFVYKNRGKLARSVLKEICQANSHWSTE